MISDPLTPLFPFCLFVFLLVVVALYIYILVFDPLLKISDVAVETLQLVGDSEEVTAAVFAMGCRQIEGGR